MKRTKIIDLLNMHPSQVTTPPRPLERGTGGEVSHRFNNASFLPLPALSAFGGQGVSGAFAGYIPKGFSVPHDRVLVAGGCNFPDVPAAEGGQKVFYTDIYAIALDGKETWWRAGSLPCALAYGASVTTPEGLVCLGGTADGQKSEDFAVLLTLGTSGEAISQDLPPLPSALDNFAAAYGDGFIYVAGGLHNGIPNRKAFRLKWPLPASWFESQTGAAWETLPDVPGPARVQPAAAVQKGALASNFYLLGGFDPRYRKAVSNGVYYDTRKGE